MASDYCVGQYGYRTFLSLWKVLLNSATLDRAVLFFILKVLIPEDDVFVLIAISDINQNKYEIF